MSCKALDLRGHTVLCEFALKGTHLDTRLSVMHKSHHLTADKEQVEERCLILSQGDCQLPEDRTDEPLFSP